jgi:hypothetical protein
MQVGLFLAEQLVNPTLGFSLGVLVVENNGRFSPILACLYKFLKQALAFLSHCRCECS